MFGKNGSTGDRLLTRIALTVSVGVACRWREHASVSSLCNRRTCCETGYVGVRCSDSGPR